MSSPADRRISRSVSVIDLTSNPEIVDLTLPEVIDLTEDTSDDEPYRVLSFEERLEILKRWAAPKVKRKISSDDMQARELKRKKNEA